MGQALRQDYFLQGLSLQSNNRALIIGRAKTQTSCGDFAHESQLGICKLRWDATSRWQAAISKKLAALRASETPSGRFSFEVKKLRWKPCEHMLGHITFSKHLFIFLVTKKLTHRLTLLGSASYGYILMHTFPKRA